MKKITITENETGQRLDRFTRKLLKEAALSEIYKGIRKGDIKVNGKKSKEGYMLA
ncbi:MAG: RluA family pseudouridine synthase, partial [Lutispora sp.]|nr:RluA family pseudouridine synthase [Lutispora sp.]